MTKILNLPFLFTTSHLVIYNLKDDIKKKMTWKVDSGRWEEEEEENGTRPLTEV